jgi:DnaJ-class molecular chaperone
MNIEGKGLPHLDNPNRYGLLFVKFILDFPTALEDAQKKSFVDLWTAHH